MQPLYDNVLLSIIQQIRLSDEDSLHLVDDLSRAIQGRKIMLKYTNDVTSKCIYLTRSTMWKLRSFLINKSSDTFSNDKSAEYLNDVFVDSSYVLELYLV